MVRKKDKPRIIPEQDKRICASICFFQLTMVLSCVAIVYLSVAVYSPSFKAFKSGYHPEPVMCQTIEFKDPKYCNWASCGEWCLTKTSGYCPQIVSTVRRNGTDIQFNNCTGINVTQCPQVDRNRFKKFNCNNGTICSNLHGLFNCSNGHCKNISEFMLCHHVADGPSIDPEKDNSKLNGYFECYGPKCSKVKKDFHCDRYCPKITTLNINVIILQDNSVITADCEDATAFNEANGNNPPIKISPTKFWNESDGMIMTSCMTVNKEHDKIIIATDCLNGTLIDTNSIPHPFMNFTQFWKIYENSTISVDPTQRFLPKQSNLTIYNSSRLLINLEGCVNTLRGECREFGEAHNKNGDNNTAQSRYRCFYNPTDNSHVIIRFDLDQTYQFLLVTLIVPSVLFVISSIALIVITKSVKVGDDAKMRCICCSDNDDLQPDYISTTSKKSRNKKRYNIDDDDDDILHDDDNINPIELQVDQLNQHEIGSTKSLIPLSPCEESTEKNFLKDINDPTKNCSDKSNVPLVII